MATVLQPGTLADLLAQPEDRRLELIRGTLIEKAAPTIEHAEAQAGTTGTMQEFFQRKRGGGPGGWKFFTELDVQFGQEVLRPDVCGYLRERVQDAPRRRPMALRPDWVCEILSVPNESHDRVEKLETYFRCGVPHYWLIDPVEGTLEVLRRTDLAFALVLTAHRGQRIRTEPFHGVELSVDELLTGDSAEQSDNE